MPLVTTPGSPFTWNAATFTWASSDAGKTWDTMYPNGYAYTDSETVTVTEAKNASAGKIFAETCAFLEADTVDYFNNFAEAFDINDAVALINGFSPVFNEPVRFTEAGFRDFTKNSAEAFAIAETSRKVDYGNNFAETVTATEAYNDVVAFRRSFAENFITAETVSKGPGKRLTETFKTVDTYLRQGPVVISDMAVRQDEISFARFVEDVSTGAPSGYTPFQPFVSGDYDLTRAIIKITLVRENPQQNLRLLTGKVFMDVPDVRDRGDLTIASTAAVASVVFARKFLIPPKMAFSRLGTAGAATVRFSNVTKTGFDVELVLSDGNRTTGTLSWIAEGY